MPLRQNYNGEKAGEISLHFIPLLLTHFTGNCVHSMNRIDSHFDTSKNVVIGNHL